MKGEFEQRLRQVIDEVQARPKPIILFIDEVHTLIGAGGAAGTGDAANLLKPALARGTLRTIGATTWAEYKKYIEKDPALTRRFQVVQVRRARRAKAVLHAARRRQRRWRSTTACACSTRRSRPPSSSRTATSRRASCPTRRSACSTPPARASRSASTRSRPRSRTASRRIEALEIEQGIIGREAAVGVERRQRAAPRWPSKLAHERERLAGLEKRWQDEKAIVDKVLALRAQLRGDDKPVDRAPTGDAARRTATKLLAELHVEQGKLAELQGETPLIMPVGRRAGGRQRGRRLDRHPGRPHGEERDRRRCSNSPRRSASASSARSTAWT